MSFIASTIQPAGRIGGVRAERGSGERYFFEGSVERWKEVFEVAEKRLGGGIGSLAIIRFAGIHLFRLYWRFVNSAHPAPGAFPGLTAHYDRMTARPAVRRILEIESVVGYYLPQ